MAKAMIMAIWVVGTVFLVLALGAGAITAILYGAGVERKSPAGLIDLLSPSFEVVTPTGGAGPYPTVILFHGCGGLRSFEGEKTIMREYAAEAAAAGYAAVIVDSLGPRGIDFGLALDRVCGGRLLRGAERAGDVVAATLWVKDQPWADSDRIILAGWSHGGWAVMDAMTHDFTRSQPQNLTSVPVDALQGVVGAHITYPYLGPIARSWRHAWRTTPTTRLVFVEHDTITPTERALPVVDRLREAGVPVETVTLAGLTHGFDEREHVDGSSFVFDEDAATQARAAFVAFLQEAVPIARTPAPLDETPLERPDAP